MLESSSNLYLHNSNWRKKYQPVPTFKEHAPVQMHRRPGAPLLLVLLPILAGLVLVTLHRCAPTYSDGVTDAKIVKDTSNQVEYDGMLTIHKGLAVSEERLSAGLLCRPNSSQETTMMPLNWTTYECFDVQENGTKIPNVNACSVKSLMAKEPLWVECASQYNQSLLSIRDKNDTYDPKSCPLYPEPNNSDHHALLKVPIHDFVSNIFHQMVIYGRPMWCVLHAVTKFAAQAELQGMKWTVEYKIDPGMRGSRYVERLFRSLSSSHTQNNNIMTPYELQGNLSLREDTVVAPHGMFRPDTQFSEWLADTSLQVRRQVRSRDNTIASPEKTPPFVLLVLRATDRRRLAGAESGTATDIVLALLDRSLPVFVMDSADASIEEQILLFEAATVVISMHGAGLTNMIWMRPGESLVIEVAASYGWGLYLDENNTCAVTRDEPELYKKGGYYNLARRFGVNYELVHPIYATRPPEWPSNPAGKLVYYVDSNALADLAENAVNDMKLLTSHRK